MRSLVSSCGYTCDTAYAKVIQISSASYDVKLEYSKRWSYTHNYDFFGGGCYMYMTDTLPTGITRAVRLVLLSSFAKCFLAS